MSLFQPVRRRAGVIVRVMSTNRSVHSPVCSVISWMGFAPRLSVTACHTNTASGIRLAPKTLGLRSHDRHNVCRIPRSTLEILFQVHPGIEVSHLVGIAIKQQGWTLREFSNTAFTRLAPPWVWHIWIHIGIEAILLQSRGHPRGHRLFLNKADFDNGFDALKAVFPWHDQPQWRPVLVRQHLAIQSHSENRKWMHGLIHPQAFDIGPGKHCTALAWQLFRVIEGCEGDIFRLRGR